MIIPILIHLLYFTALYGLSICLEDNEVEIQNIENKKE